VSGVNQKVNTLTGNGDSYSDWQPKALFVGGIFSQPELGLFSGQEPFQVIAMAHKNKQRNDTGARRQYSGISIYPYGKRQNRRS